MYVVFYFYICMSLLCFLVEHPWGGTVVGGSRLASTFYFFIQVDCWARHGPLQVESGPLQVESVRNVRDYPPCQDTGLQYEYRGKRVKVNVGQEVLTIRSDVNQVWAKGSDRLLSRQIQLWARYFDSFMVATIISTVVRAVLLCVLPLLLL